MQRLGLSGRMIAIGFALAMGAPLVAAQAEAASSSQRAGQHREAARGHVRAVKYGLSRWSGGSRLQCVPFARENSGIELSGNANTWWDNAQGVYERGARPEVGSVLNFRANGRMRMGHVAVVANVIDGRNVEIDHANWSGPGVGRGGISRNITVVDVSPANDWSAVRVGLGNTGEFGSVYPTYGFIYDRPDRGTMVANAGNTPAPVLNAAPRDLRPAAERYAARQDFEEVAEAPEDSTPRYRRVAYHSRARVSTNLHAAGPRAPGAHATARTRSGKPAAVQTVSAASTKAHAAPKATRHRF